jgi:phosphoribosylformimino-5-aminoimidazole carboxamide ribotide isomerase
MIDIIPAIDILDGQCVRLTKGDYSSKRIYSGSPLRVAQSFEDAGVRRLHLVDLNGAREKRIVNISVLEKIAKHTGLKIDFGGGIQSDQDIQQAFECGASQVTAGSVAVKQPGLICEWLQKYGAERIILGADCRNGRVSISGWLEDTGLDVFDFVSNYERLGLRQVISTDVNRDGVMSGPAFDLYTALKERFPEMFIIASGGIGSIEDVKQLDKLKIDGIIIGKALFEQKITLDQLKPFL